MCGGKTSKESQTYTPNAAVGAGGTGALTLAGNYANSPYSMPLQQVAGFTPFQQQAFNQTVQQQGAWSPFVNQANNYFTQSAQPVSDNDIAQYLNPYKENVMADLKDVFGSQMKQATDSAVTNAGGVGANRVGVAQANLGKQQGLAAGTILSGIYDRALAAAQQDKTRQQTAGYGVGQLAPMTSQLGYTDTSNLYNMGSQQQQFNQAGLNAQYQWDVGKVMDPATKAQFQAQITGGLAPAMGGTTVTERPGPSPWSQIAGAGMAAAGAFMGNPAMISGGLNSAFGGGGGGQMGGTGQGWFGYGAQPGQQAQGGYGSYWAPSPNGGLAPRFYSEGGEVSPYDVGQRFDEGGDVLPRPTPFPGGIFGGLGGDPQSDWTPSPEAQRRIQGAFDDIGGLPPEVATGQSRPTPQPESALPFTDMGPPVTYRSPASTTLGRPVQPAPSALPDLEGPAHTGYDFAQGRPEENQYDRFAASPWFALMNAGLATMAGTSPFALTNIGKGALAGVDTVRKQQGEAMGRRQIQMQARRLMQQMQHQRDVLAETRQHHRATETHQGNMLGHQRDVLGETRRYHDIQADIARRRAESADIVLRPDPVTQGVLRPYDRRTGRPLGGTPPAASPPAAPPDAPGAAPRLVPAPNDIAPLPPASAPAAAPAGAPSGGAGVTPSADPYRTKTLWEQASYWHTGGMGLARDAWTAFGPQIGLPGFKDTREVRQYFDVASNNLIRALSINPHFPVGEIRRLLKENNVSPGIATPIQAQRANMVAVHRGLSGQLEKLERDAADDRVPVAQRRDAIKSAGYIREFLNTMGVPREALLPEGSIINRNGRRYKMENFMPVDIGPVTQ